MDGSHRGLHLAQCKEETLLELSKETVAYIMRE